jgi:hypothetical protein
MLGKRLMVYLMRLGIVRSICYDLKMLDATFVDFIKVQE